MRNGLLVYSTKYPLCNIGDYIQSLAARQFVGATDTLVCREALDEYFGEEIRLILNGWFTHEPRHWPPSRMIHPLFISFHINSVARAALTNEASLAYLRNWAPIGCRDLGTVQLLRGHGVEAYFSGCLTLTLGRTWKRGSSSGAIYFVDPFFEYKKDASSLAKYASVLARNHTTVRAVATGMFGKVDVRSLLKSAAFYAAYRTLFSDETLKRASYVRQEMPNAEIGDHAAKFAHAEMLLENYASAAFVVTSRIHCALPCLGIGTPVLYVENQQQAETSSCRLDGLRDLLHVVRYSDDELRSEWAECIGPEFAFANREDHKGLVEKLNATCEEFARSPPDPNCARGG